MKLENALRRLDRNGPERQAIAAGEIDAVVDYAGSNVILLPAARRALRAAAAPVRIANGLLALLPEAEYRRLAGSLEPLTAKLGAVLCEPGAPIGHVYFPIDCLVSLLAAAPGSPALEVGLVGYEGMVGIPLVLGEDVASVRAVVQATGTVMRMDAASFRRELRKSPLLHRVLQRYVGATLVQARRTVACNRFHAVEARVARWLLMTGDRVRGPEFFLTQDVLAGIFGVRRGTINAAAGPMQQRGLIRYRRGKLGIVDRKGLEAVACGCYASMP